MKTYGFIPSKIESDHYILGGTGLPKTILQPLGNWEQYLPTYEPQFENFETAGCSVWGTQNAIETLMKRIEMEEPNYSERFTYILARVRPPGADPHAVAEVIRKDGLIDEALLPTDTATFEEFIKPDPMTQDLIDKGEEWLNKYDFGHEWIFTNNPSRQIRLPLLKEALQYSPVCISVSAWASDVNNLYVSNFPNNHWVMCYGIEGDSILVFDTYDQSKKKLHPDHEIMMAKRYYIGPSTRQEKLSWIEMILNWIQEQINLLKKKDMTPYKPLEEVLPINTVGKLEDFCLAIRDFEGKPGDLNYRNNNPGNIRGRDGKFLKFPTYAQGWSYLKDYVTRAATGKHKAYKPDFTIKQFFNVYAPSSDNNQPDLYANWVASRIGLATTFQIKNLV